ncbi:hypothetical protein TP2_01770 [Thioclava pacifica DSM 10166]|uniref:Uncharacterized protein n=2 Tax=Thioclava pacifica TaxID=285109 RepID=A0A074K3Y4_9RHOB|nr:hypothetical protein TP2_01770 [Thioclava pacifica DSM 10166]
MRLSYGARRPVYLVVAGVSLSFLVHGRETEGARHVMKCLSGGWAAGIVVINAGGY